MFGKGNTSARRLTGDQVRKIRISYEQGMTQGALAREFGVNISTIGNIVRYESWANQAVVTRDSSTITDQEIAASLARLNELLAVESPPIEKKEDDIPAQFDTPEYRARLRGYRGEK